VEGSGGSGRRIITSAIIRPFNFPDDYPEVVDLWEHAGPGVQVGRSDTLEEVGKKVQRDPDLFLVVEVDDKLIGSVIGGFDGRRGMIYHLAVADDYRQQGIGAALMDEVERRLKGKGCLKAYLLVVDGNEYATQYYEKRGWQAMNVTVLGKEL
jgi:ribosomal protein S18 acetylase RimI-like enzyme